MGSTAKETSALAHNSAFEYEDHPFQPSRIAASAAPEEKKETRQPLTTHSQLKTRLHGKQRKFEREEPRRTGGQARSLPV
jgi:hypothetical protein